VVRAGVGVLVVAGVAIGLAAPATGWGDRTHPAVNQLAVDTLPTAAADYFRPHAQELVRRANEPDTVMRAREGREEEIRHFINLDTFMGPPFRGFPRTYRDAVTRFGRRKVEENGVLPWVILRFERQLRDAIRAGDTERAVREAAYLGHYVCEVYQPLHLTKNYDGQLTGAPGIHKRFENGVVDDHIERHIAAARRRLQKAEVLVDRRAKVFEAMFRSYGEVERVLEADVFARRHAKVGSTAYYARMRELLDPLVRTHLAEAARMVGSFWLTAWKAGLQAKEPRKNNFPFSHPIFSASSAGPQSQRLGVGSAMPTFSLLPGRQNLHQIWARILQTYSCAAPN